MSDQQNLNQTMLTNEQLGSLKETIGGYSPLQLAWASGYLAAKSEGSSVAVLPPVIAGKGATTSLICEIVIGDSLLVLRLLKPSFVFSAVATVVFSAVAATDGKFRSDNATSHCELIPVL